MILKTPKFWYADSVNIFLKYLLLPISKVYYIFANLHYRRKYRCILKNSKVIAIGGITVGGSGKTIVTESICDVLRKINRKTAILSRGFGRKSKSTFMVDSNIHTFKDAGDEPLLLSRTNDVFVGKNRIYSAQLARKNGHDTFILDDGITQRHIKPDTKLVVLDNTQKFGNGEMLPLGPNRLNFDIANDIDAAVVITWNKSEDITEIKSKIPENIPILLAYLKQDFSQIECKGNFFAFCGIGYPQKFFDTVKKTLSIVGTASFPDHHPFSDNDITDLMDIAKTRNAKLLTTEKDFVRIPKRFHKFITTIPVKIVWKDYAKLVSSLKI